MMRNISSINIAGKLAISAFLVSTIVATISAVIMLGVMLTEHDSGFRIPDIENIKLKYSDPILVTSMKTTMYEYVADDEDIEIVDKWIKEGRENNEYFENEVFPIIKEDCTNCHSRGSTMTDAVPNLPLSNYEDVMKYTMPGYSWEHMAKQAHLHLFGIGSFLIAVTLIFSYTRIYFKIRCALIIVSWVSLWIDVLCWWMARYYPEAAFLIVGAGTGLIGTTIIMCLLTLLDLWINHPFIDNEDNVL
jgi:hypothetical protein